jgi:uncharacterized protein YbjT (DUF2867 family)
MSERGDRRIFVAGSTGAVGRALLAQAERAGVRGQLVPHLRPRAAHTVQTTPPADAVVCDLADAAALQHGMSGCTTLVQLIGTMRKRFAQGDTYESSDVGTTVALATAARAVGVNHLVLLSSVGAGSPRGAYLEAKARAEAAVRDSGIPHTIVRPSAFSGEDRGAPLWLSAPMKGLGLARWAPIAVDDVARAILEVALARAPLNAVLEGKSLWQLVEVARGLAG